jgi:hypothetical protein
MMKLRWERFRHTRCASARRVPGSASGTRRPVSVEVGGVQAHEGPADLAVNRLRARELAELLALGGRRRGEADAGAAHEGEGGRAQVLGGREERSVLHPELEVLEPKRHPPRPPGRRPQREVHQAVDLAGLLA